MKRETVLKTVERIVKEKQLDRKREQEVFAWRLKEAMGRKRIIIIDA